MSHTQDFSHLLGCHYNALWAHTPEEEKALFNALIHSIEEALDRDPTMHVYHFSQQEPSILYRLARTYHRHEDLLSSWREQGVFVDLFTAVTHLCIIGQPGYSLKDLEPLYCGNIARHENLQDAVHSVLLYRQARIDHECGRMDHAHALYTDLELYNEYDCCSMVLLAQWIRAQHALYCCHNNADNAQDAHTHHSPVTS